MQNKVVSLPEQTIIDLVIQEMGSIEGLFDFMKANNIQTLNIATNKLFNVPAVLRPELVQYLKSSNKSAGKEPIQISTGLQTIPAPGTGGGDVHIFNSDLSIDETITAPGERELEDITITLVNTADETISTETLAAAVDGTVTAPDGTVVLKRSNGTVIDYQIVKSGSTIDKTIANSTVVLKRSNGTTITSQSVMAESTIDHNFGDSTVVIKRSNGTTIASQTVMAISSINKTIDDSIVVVKNTEGTTLGTQAVMAESTIDKTIADISFTDSDGSVSSVPAGVNITAKPYLKTAKLLKTDQTTSYRTGDDGDLQIGREVNGLTLSVNNPFGTTDRFTGVSGLTITDSIVIDWTTFDGNDVLGYYIGSTSTNRSWTTSIDWALSLNIGGFIGWHLSNINELLNLIRNGIGFGSINYNPFLIGAVNIWTSTTNNSNTSEAIFRSTSGGISVAAKTSTYRTIACRYFEVNGTTLT
jgi:hypothetical protein